MLSLSWRILVLSKFIRSWTTTRDLNFIHMNKHSSLFHSGLTLLLLQCPVDLWERIYKQPLTLYLVLKIVTSFLQLSRLFLFLDYYIYSLCYFSIDSHALFNNTMIMWNSMRFGSNPFSFEDFLTILWLHIVFGKMHLRII